MPTISVNIAAGADDGFSYVSSTFGTFSNHYYSATFFQVGIGLGKNTSALRFQSIAIAQGITISSATLTIIRDGASAPIVANIFGDNVNNSAPWGSSNRVKNIPKTTAHTTLDSSSATSANNVTAIVQEIINRAGWASGNALAFGIFPVSGTQWRGFAFEKGAPNIPNLSITYGGAPPAVNSNFFAFF